MRIALLGPAYPFRGGIATFNEQLAAELLAQGYEVQIFTFTVQYPAWLFPGKTQYQEGPPPPLPICRTLHTLDPLSWLKTGQAIAAFRPDFVLTKFWLPFMAPALGSALRIARRRYPALLRLAILDNVMPHEARPGDRLFTRYFIGAIEGALAMSRTVEEDWQRLTPKPVQRLFHPIYDSYGPPLPREEACRALGLDPTCRYFLFFGLIRPYKGLDLLLEAWKAPALQAHATLRLLLAGELYEPLERYTPLLEAPENQGRVVFHEGFVPDEKVPLYFSAADAVVQPYRSATQSGVTQIAYHFLRPMVVTRTGGLPDMVPHGEAGLVCEPNPAALTQALVQMAETPLERFRPALERLRDAWSWCSFVQQLLKFAASLQDGRPVPE